MLTFSWEIAYSIIGSKTKQTAPQIEKLKCLILQKLIMIAEKQ